MLKRLDTEHSYGYRSLTNMTKSQGSILNNGKVLSQRLVHHTLVTLGTNVSLDLRFVTIVSVFLCLCVRVVLLLING